MRRSLIRKRRIDHIANTAVFGLLLAGATTAAAQSVKDSTYAWRAYAAVATCSITIYDIESDDRTRMVVIREIAENRGPPATRDARYLVDHIGRDFDFDPVTALWVFHWGSFSYAGARESRREIFLRATFRWSSSGVLGGPAWRLVAREDLEELTDRKFR